LNYQIVSRENGACRLSESGYMSDLKAIQDAVIAGNYQYTTRALIRTTERRISRAEIEQVIAVAEIIEEYPDDKYGPSCLLYGETRNGRRLHVLVSSLPVRVKIISAYDPDPDEWEDYRVRRAK